VTYNVLEAMRRTNARQIIFSSSGAVYGEPKVMRRGGLRSDFSDLALRGEQGRMRDAHHRVHPQYEMRCWIYRFGNIVGPNPTHA